MHLWQSLCVPRVKTSRWAAWHRPRRAALWGTFVLAVPAKSCRSRMAAYKSAIRGSRGYETMKSR